MPSRPHAQARHLSTVTWDGGAGYGSSGDSRGRRRTVCLHAPEARSPQLRQGSSASEPDGQVCGLFAVDIAGFTKVGRDEEIQAYIHRSLYEMLDTAFCGSDVPWSDCSHEDRGDGTIVVAPPTIPVARLIPIPDRLRILIRRHNRVSCDAAHIQLRTAIHLGPVRHDGHGFVGHDINLLCRLLDARQPKQLLARSTAEIALIISDYLYVTVICRQPALLNPVLFRSLNVRVKETRARAWLYLPESQG